MCGIAGFLSLQQGMTAHPMDMLAGRMAEALQHRGPDSQGVWSDASHGIALAHRRLSIIDLSAHGHQPMVSASGRYVLSFNGEIYNFQSLRARLEYPWQSESDTEVILAAVEAWGIEKALTAFNGMFALALWDREKKQLILARDRMGEKPLYYGWVNGLFVFASELKAFHTLSGWPPTINRQALTLFMRYSYIPAPHSIYENIHKLEPASYLCVTAEEASAPKAYWSFTDMVHHSTSHRFTGSPEDALTALEEQLKAAVQLRMIADVPLGAFLSGGIDSSLIVSLMQAHSSRPVKTFSIGFNEPGFDEAPYAKAVAKHLGTEHTEVYVTPAQAQEVIPHLPHFYDEPFADASQIPTYLVSRFAREHVTVALSGDGGDEIFGGYNRYLHGPALWRILSAIPLSIRRPVARALVHAHRLAVSRITADDRSAAGRFSRKLANYYEKIDAPTREAFYRTLCSVCDHPETFIIGAQEPVEEETTLAFLEYAEWMMAQDALTYFTGDILTKVDRAAMAVSLETRIPFSDPEVMAFAWRIPPEMKIKQGQGKWLLRQLLYRYVPEPLVGRAKTGFAVPIGEWLRGPLKGWAEDLLSENRLAQQGYLDPAAVAALWKQHQAGKGAMERPLWNILMFQSWLSRNPAPA